MNFTFLIISFLFSSFHGASLDLNMEEFNKMLSFVENVCSKTEDCRVGEVCVLPALEKEQSGICHRLAQLGQVCGGDEENAPVCAEDLYCYEPAFFTWIWKKLGRPGVCDYDDYEEDDPFLRSKFRF